MSPDFDIAKPATFPFQFPTPPISNHPQSADPAIALAQQGQTQRAEQAFRDQLQRTPHDPIAHHNFAVFLSSQNRAKEAVEHYEHSLRLKPQYPEAHRNFGLLLCNQRRFSESIDHLWAAVTLRPDDIQTLSALATAFLTAKHRDEAIPLLRHAIRLSRAEASLHNQLGLALFDAGRLNESETAFLEALSLDPKFVSAHNNLGSLYKAMGRSQEAFTCFELALALDPDSVKTKWNRALTLLSVGNFERGWQEYEWRWHREETPCRQLPKPPWKGEPLEGRRILLYPEQGLGDTIQFIRYAPLLKAQGAHVIYECQSPLIATLKDAVGIDQLIPEGQPIPPFDFHAPLLGLPRLFKTTQQNVPGTIPYLTADPVRAAAWKTRLNDLIKPGELRVGIAWQGNPHHQWDHFRSLPLSDLEPLTQLPNVAVISLQRGPGIEQIDAFQRLTNNALVVPTDGRQTTPEHLADTAAIMANLDLIVTVDTATAHLAGALGRRTWVALSFIADWRWMIDRQDTPWYPTMRLFRQRTLGDWHELVARLANQLALLEHANTRN